MMDTAIRVNAEEIPAAAIAAEMRLERAAEMNFVTARPFVERELLARSWQQVAARYIRTLADRSQIEGVTLEGEATPQAR